MVMVVLESIASIQVVAVTPVVSTIIESISTNTIQVISVRSV